MRADQYSRIDSIKVKARADYKCQHCGSDEAIQAHAPDGDHTDWREGIALCGNCHADEHPDVPRSLFLSKEKQPYWHNISARALGVECDCHARTVIRRAKRLGVASNCALSDIDKERIKASILNLTNVCMCDKVIIKKENFMSSQSSAKEEKKPVCPNCGSQNVYYRIKKGYICRRCGEEWKKE